MSNMLTVLNCNYGFLQKIALPIKQLYCVNHLSTANHAFYAGHSKWANIRHIKATKDAQKSALFTKISRQIRLAIQDGGSADVSVNSNLKNVVDEALRKNMPMLTIQNNIKKYRQNKNDLRRYTMDIQYKQKIFAVCVIYTDNYARVKMDMATVLKKFSASLLDANNLFKEIGLVQAEMNKSRMQRGSELEMVVMEDAIKFNAEDVEIIDKSNGVVNFLCRPLEIMPFRKSLEASGYVIDYTDHVYIPLTMVELLPEELKEYQEFTTKLKEVPGVEEIHDNVYDP